MIKNSIIIKDKNMFKTFLKSVKGVDRVPPLISMLKNND